MDNNNFGEEQKLAKPKHRHRRTQSNSEYNLTSATEKNTGTVLPCDSTEGNNKLTNEHCTMDTEEAIKKSANEEIEREIIIEALEIPSLDNSMFFSDDFAFGKYKRHNGNDMRDGKLKFKHFPQMNSIRETDQEDEGSSRNKPDSDIPNHLPRKPLSNLPIDFQDQKEIKKAFPFSKKFNFKSMDPKIKELAKKLDFDKKHFSPTKKKTLSLAQDDFTKITKELKGHFRQISDGKLTIKYSESKREKKSVREIAYEKKIFSLETDVEMLKRKVIELDQRNININSSGELLKAQNLQLEIVPSSF